MYSDLPDIMNPVSALTGHRLPTDENGEVYLEAGELELGGSRSLHAIHIPAVNLSEPADV